MATLVAKLLGPACFIYPGLADRIISIMHDLKRLHREALPFLYLVSSLRNPFLFDVTGERTDDLKAQYLSEYSSIWSYRTQLMVLFNGVVSSGDEATTRVRRREMLERAGLRGAIRFLVAEKPTEEFRNQVVLYNQDREEDSELLNNELKDKSVDVNDSIQLLQSTFQQIQQLPNATLLSWLLSSITRHVTSIAVSAKDGAENAMIRDEVNTILLLVQATTKSLHSSIASFDSQENSKLVWRSNFYDSAIEIIGVPESLAAAAASPQETGQMDKLMEEIQRLQLLVHALREERGNRQMMKSLNSEIETAIKKRLEKDTEAAESADDLPLPAAELQPSRMQPNTSDDWDALITKAPKPTKNLQWENTTAVSSTSPLWQELFTTAYQQNLSLLLNEDTQSQLLGLFEKPEARLSVVAGSASVLAETKGPVRIFKDQLSRSIEIFLAATRKSPLELVDAILKVNSAILNLDVISRIQSLLPPPDVLDSLLAYKGPTEDLGKAEAFILALFAIPRIQVRLRCLAYYHRFAEEYSLIIPDITIVRAAVQEVQASEKLKIILQLVLVTGNFLNAGTFRGNARAFKIKSLLNLKDTASNGSGASPTLLHFLARALEKLDGDYVNFMNDMPNVEAASRVSINSLSESVKDLAAGFKFVKAEVAEPKSNMLPEDQFRTVFDIFCEKSGKKLGKLQDNVALMWSEVQTLFSLFSEDCDEPERFFESLLKFSRALNQAHQENIFYDLESSRESFYSNIRDDNDASYDQGLAEIASTPSARIEEADDAAKQMASLELTKLVMGGGSLASTRKTIKKVMQSNA
ncbi:hypothetical protein HDU91_002664 [Kappamyces sp. JEL0680]|nr:hypothetical protein HDU91_002664 [Kappamyces sp. JEL0680]